MNSLYILFKLNQTDEETNERIMTPQQDYLNRGVNLSLEEISF